MEFQSKLLSSLLICLDCPKSSKNYINTYLDAKGRRITSNSFGIKLFNLLFG